MPQNFIAVDREQSFLLPPSLRDWLPADHLAWYVIDAVAQMDLTAFYADYRDDGHGRAAYEPSMMVAMILYAFATKQRSSRGIERHCRQDIAYRVITGNLIPDHATIARFVDCHEQALAGLFGDVLALCAKAGLVKVGVIAIDGTKMQANANRDRTVDYERIAREIIAEAKAIDEAEDELYGEARGDELPEQLRTPEGRRRALREAKQRLEAERDEQRSMEGPAAGGDPRLELDLDRERLVSSQQGRRGWMRDASRQLDEHRKHDARPVGRSRTGRLLEAERRLEQELEAERAANEAYENYRARGVMKDGRRFGGPPKLYQLSTAPAGQVNTTDPDSRIMKAHRGFVQGYNAQVVATEQQIVLAAEITVDAPDFGHLKPMMQATRRELQYAGVSDTPGVAVADAGYWNERHMDSLAGDGTQVLIPPDSRKRKGGERPGWRGGRYASMRQVLDGDHGGDTYRKRQQMIEPVFANTKFNRRFDRFHRRGRSAVQTEWRLITATPQSTQATQPPAGHRSRLKPPGGARDVAGAQPPNHRALRPLGPFRDSLPG